MKENEIKIFSVIVDAEGNDKWVSDGVFVDKPKLKTEVKLKGVNSRLLQEILNITGLTKEGIVLWDLDANIQGPQSVEITVGYYNDNNSTRSQKVIQIYG